MHHRTISDVRLEGCFSQTVCETSDPGKKQKDWRCLPVICVCDRLY
jgi:hypothetical protein